MSTEIQDATQVLYQCMMRTETARVRSEAARRAYQNLEDDWGRAADQERSARKALFALLDGKDEVGPGDAGQDPFDQPQMEEQFPRLAEADHA